MPREVAGYLSTLFFFSLGLWVMDLYFFTFQYSFAGIPFFLTTILLERPRLLGPTGLISALLLWLAIPACLWLVLVPVAAFWGRWVKGLTGREGLTSMDLSQESVAAGLIAGFLVSVLAAALARWLASGEWRLRVAVAVFLSLILGGGVFALVGLTVLNGRWVQSSILTLWILGLGFLWRSGQPGVVSERSTGRLA